MTNLWLSLVGLVVLAVACGAATVGIMKLIKGDLAEGRRELREMAEQLRRGIEDQLNRVQRSSEEQLGRLQSDNNHKLEQMRQTVAEKLEGTLERRPGESFKMIGDRLEMVHKG